MGMERRVSRATRDPVEEAWDSGVEPWNQRTASGTDETAPHCEPCEAGEAATCNTAPDTFDDADADVEAAGDAVPVHGDAEEGSTTETHRTPTGSDARERPDGDADHARTRRGLTSRRRAAIARRLREDVLAADGVDPTWRGRVTGALEDSDDEGAFANEGAVQREAPEHELPAEYEAGAAHTTGTAWADPSEGPPRTPTRPTSRHTGDDDGSGGAPGASGRTSRPGSGHKSSRHQRHGRKRRDIHYTGP